MRALSLTLALVGLPSCFSTLAPKVTLDPAAIVDLRTFDYSDWDAVLAAHVDTRGSVDYPALQLAPARLNRFVALLAEVGPKTRPELFPSREDELAYYINAYNALTIYNVVERYPIASVDDDRYDFFYWTRFYIDGDELNLYDLERDLIVPAYSEPRVHFALNCASAGCPRLPSKAFRGETLEAQLTAETRRFLLDPRNVSLQGRELVISELFEWYADEFEPDAVTWIAGAVPELGLRPGTAVRYRPWDWALNDLPD